MTAIRGYQRSVRVASLRDSLAWVVLTFVDDLFGVFRCGFFWTGGKLREVLGLASGFPMDPEKSVDYSLLMGAFGIEVNLQSARN